MHGFCSHPRHDVAVYTQLQAHEAGAQGPRGVTGYVYTQKHTDQENWGVNHITYIDICGHKGYKL